MSAETNTLDQPSPGRRRVLLAVAAGLAAFAIVAIAVGVFATGDDDQATSAAAPTSAAPAGVAGGVAATGVPAKVVTVPELREIARASDRPLYWAGVRPGSRLEYTQTADGSAYVRYLTGSAQAGSTSGAFVVVATYSQPNAFERVSGIAKRTHLTIRTLEDGAISVSRPGRRQNAYVVFPGQPYQVEVYSPTAATTRGLVLGGHIQPVG